jgi:hypothetical protein
MSIRLMSRVWELDLPQNEKLILLAFADYADDDGLSFPSIARVAWKSGYSERQTRAIVSELRSRQVLESIDGHAGGRGVSAAYRIHPENHAKLAPFSTENSAVDRRKTMRSATQKGAKSRINRARILRQPSENLSSNRPRASRAEGTHSSLRGGKTRAEQRRLANLAAAGFEVK